MKSVKNYLFMGLLLGSALFTGCSKDKDQPSGNTDEAAAARVVGTYQGTIHPLDISVPDYFNATVIITKESGNKVKVAPKSGEAYSAFTTKIIPIQAVLGVDNATAEDPQGTLFYEAGQKTLSFITKATAAEDVVYRFEGTKQ